jgi:hypothetical protein
MPLSARAYSAVNRWKLKLKWWEKELRFITSKNKGISKVSSGPIRSLANGKEKNHIRATDIHSSSLWNPMFTSAVWQLMDTYRCCLQKFDLCWLLVIPRVVWDIPLYIS